MEGFWYYYLTGCKHNEFKTYNGFTAKTEGKKLRDDRIDKDGLTACDLSVLTEAIKCKLRQNKDILKLLVDTDLPLAHYYFYGLEDNPKVYYLDAYDWIVKLHEGIRSVLKQHNWGK